MLKRFRNEVRRTCGFVGFGDTISATARSRLALRSAAVVILAFAILADGASDDVVFRDGEDVLTIEMLRRSLDLGQFDPLSSLEDFRIEILVGKAGAAVIPYYYEIMTTPEDPLAGPAAGRLMYMAPTEYRTELRQILLKPEYISNPPTGIIGVLDKIGLAEDAPLLYPHLLNKQFPRVRLEAAKVLEKIGDAEALEGIEAMWPDVERVQRELMEELPSLREKWLRQGVTSERADDLVDSARGDRERVYREMVATIERLRERVTGEVGPESTSPREPSSNEGVVSREVSSGPASVGVPEPEPMPAEYGAGGGGTGKRIAMGLGALVLGILCAWMLTNRRRKEPPAPAPDT